MKKKEVAYIHCHTINSEKDAIAQADDYALKISMLNKESSSYEIVGCSITEHGNCHSMVSARISLENKNIKHMLGVEAYLCDGDEKKSRDTRFHFVLLAINNHYKDYVHLMTETGHNKFVGRGGYKTYPITTHEMLEKYGKGFIGTTACLGGRVAKLIMQDKYEEAKEYVLYLKKLLYKLYLEVQPHDTYSQIIVNESLVKMSKETGIPIVIGVDAHYANTSEHDVYDSFRAMNNFASKDDDDKEEEREVYYSHLRSFEELEEYCIKYNIPLSAIDNTYEIYKDTCSVSFKPVHKMANMPKFPVPNGYSEHDYLVELCHKKLIQKIKNREQKDIITRFKRLNEELRVIENSGFSGYFLVLHDFAKAMRERKILLGKGRGCFVKNSRVLMSNYSYKNIQDINIGDYVFNKDGERAKVLDVMEYEMPSNEKTQIIDTEAGNIKIKCTKDHKILCNNGEYKEAKDITTDDYICMIKPIHRDRQDGNVALAEIIGIYMSYFKGDCLNFFRFKKVATRFCDLCTDVFRWKSRAVIDKYNVKVKLTQYQINTLEDYICTDTIYSKEYERAILKGVFLKSLLYDKAPYVYLTKYSNYIKKIGFRNDIYIYGTNMYKGETLSVASCSREILYKYIDKPLPNSKNKKILMNDNYYMLKVKSSTDNKYKGMIYDLCIEGDHSYNIESICVHNSAASSIVNYVLGITGVDPIKHDLLFSRFLNESRLEEPDVDLDVITRHRSDAIKYLQEKYGENRVVQIITYNRFGIKSLVQTAVKMAGGTPKEGQELSKKLENVSYEFLEKVYNHPEKEPDLTQGAINKYNKSFEEINKILEERPDIAPLVKRGNGLISNNGIHAAGIIVSGVDIKDNFPTEASTSNSAVLSLLSVDMSSVPYFNLLKIDLLGLATLQIVYDAMEAAGLSMDWFESEDYSDEDVYEFGQSDGGTSDIFQMSSKIPTRLMRTYDIRDIFGLSDASATNRPGGLAKIELLDGRSMMDLYEQNKKNGLFESLGLEDVDEIVKSSGGCALYQEQLQKIGQVVAGYSLPNSDIRIRKTIGKKKVKEIPLVELEFKYGQGPIRKIISENEKDIEVIGFGDLKGTVPKLDNDIVRFYKENTNIEVVFTDDIKSCNPSDNIEFRELIFTSDYKSNYSTGLSPIPSSEKSKYNSIGAIRNGYDDKMKNVNTIFLMLEAFSLYGFNLSHSISYATLSYNEMWLSLYYPIEFYYSVLRNYKAGTDGKLRRAIITAKKRGVTISPPDINISMLQFELFYDDDSDDPSGIIAGLSDIKDVGRTAAIPIIRERLKNGPYNSFDDFITRVIKNHVRRKNKETGKYIQNSINKKTINALILSGCFDEMEPNRYKLVKYYNLKVNKASSGYETVCGVKMKSKTHILNDVIDSIKEEEYTRISRIHLEEKYLSCSLSEHMLTSAPDKYLVDFESCDAGDKIEIVGFLRGHENKKTKTGKRYIDFKVELASSMEITCRVWDADSPRTKRNIPRGLTSTNVFNKDNSYENVRHELETYSRKISSGKFKETHKEEYEDLLYKDKKYSFLYEEKDYRPFIFKGKVEEFFVKYINISSIEELPITNLTEDKVEFKEDENINVINFDDNI